MQNTPCKNKDDNFWHRFLTAQDAGLNREWCIKVAYCDCTLEEALGNMDMDDESEFDPNFIMVEEPEDNDDEVDAMSYIPW